MSDTLTRPAAPRSETRRVFNLGLYQRRADALGATSAADRRRIAGISRSTEYRWIRGVGVPDMERAQRAAASLGVGVDDLFPLVAS